MSAPDLLAAARRPGGMTAVEATAAFDLMLAGGFAPEAGADLLVAMRERGESAIELAAWVRGLLSRAQPLDAGRPVMDIVGTGGSGRARYNASTTSCFVLAAAGVPIAKHGNRGSARPNGSFDLLEALGIPIQLPAGAHRELLDASGMCCIFARQFHPAVAAAAPFRKLAAGRVSGTIFNLAGPLANPARPQRMLIGSAKPEQAALVAETVQALGTERTVVVCGHPGIDEISVTGPTTAWEVTASGVRTWDIPTPAAPLSESDVVGGDATENATVFHRIMQGTETGALREYVIANAGAALATWRGLHPADAGTKAEARELIQSGAAHQAFIRHRSAARRIAGLSQV